MHRLGRIPPAEAEAHYYSKPVTDRPAVTQNPEAHETRDDSQSHLMSTWFFSLSCPLLNGTDSRCVTPRVDDGLYAYDFVT